MKAAIIGYGKSGKAAEKLLKLDEYSSIDIFDGDAKLGFKAIEDYKNIYDVTILSPGINRAKYPNIPEHVESEISLAYKKMKKGAQIVGITGTNGKSTTTFLTAQILNNAGINAVACGNIGKPYAECVLDDKIDVFVIELSSFQLDLLTDFGMKAAALLNVTQDHLDRYGDMESYYKSKLHILDLVEADGFFAGDDDKIIKERASEFSFDKKFIDKKLLNYPKIVGDKLEFGEFFVDLKEFKLFGAHNILNLAYSLLLANVFAKFQGDATKFIKDLKGMPHRTELVGEYRGVRYINDSKGTNVDSVITALLSTKKPSYLLIGGRDKKSDYSPLVELINKNVSEVCYFGEAADLIKAQLGSLINAAQSSFKTLEEAVKYCAENAKAGAVVLLSPACTSFDEFKNYEERGIKFAEYAKKYAGKP